MLFEIEQEGSGYAISDRAFQQAGAGSLGLKEKEIEHWLARNPKLLLPNEEVLIIGQSVPGSAMADILALDSLGKLVIVEIKRGRTGRDTVAQLLAYAVRLRGVTYAELNEMLQRYKPGSDLFTRFSEFFDGQTIAREDLGRRHRIIVVAAEGDADLRLIVEWLADYGVPIQFVPFTIYAEAGSAQGVPRFFEMEGLVTQPEPAGRVGDWQGDWIFNTNETYAPSAYARMFRNGVAAIYGYANGGRNLEGSRGGDKIFAYVNRRGLCAVGVIVDGEVKPGTGVFLDAEGRQQDGEYHLMVQWELILAEGEALSVKEALALGYRLPVRSVFGKLHNGPAVRALETEIRARIAQDDAHCATMRMHR